jgi:nitroimidazol reductase NimA-like FMN-containing flavoprotein (pyridoxamine 5'-phosphate oxidase superfamily)
MAWKGTYGIGNRPKVPGTTASAGARSRPETTSSTARRPLTEADRENDKDQPTDGETVTSRGLDVLGRDECLDLLRANSFGRIGMKIADDPVILPVFYAMVEGEIVFRTDPGTKLIAAVLETRVAFEVDDRGDAWSVLVIGHAHEVRHPSPEMTAIPALGDIWPAGERERFVRIEIDRATGRRFSRVPSNLSTTAGWTR